MRILFGYYRSSAAYRVRIALALKGLDYTYEAVNLAPGFSEHRSESYLKLNPQGRVPFLVDSEVKLSQSPAILEYLEETYPAPALLPAAAADRAYVRQLSALIACDIHPLNNLAVLGRLKSQFGADAQAVNAWYHHWILEGFKAFETLLETSGRTGDYCFGDRPTFAEVYLLPQVANARRFSVPLDAFPRILEIDARCRAQAVFQKAAPEAQPDAPKP